MKDWKLPQDFRGCALLRDAAGDVRIMAQGYADLPNERENRPDTRFGTASAGKVFVMGDDRAGSIDSRNTEIGCIAQEQIIGKVVGLIRRF